MYEHDLKTAYINYEEAKNLFLLGSANRVALMLKDIDHLDKVAPVAKTTVKQTTGGEIRTVAQVNKSLFSALMIEKIAMFLVLGLVILVAALNIFASLILITMEKTRDIAVLRSIGATSKGVKRIFLALGSVIGVVGIISGLILGLGTCAYIYWVGISLPSAYYLRELPVAVQPLDVVLVVVAAMLAGLLATLYPASSATSKAPSEGLRND
jgi:lipoprotein-releasing system permease protein